MSRRASTRGAGAGRSTEQGSTAAAGCRACRSLAGAEDTANHIVGGLLMGFGGVTALGCTIGQGLTGFSTLALGSILAFAAIVAGSALTMKFQYWRMAREG